MILDSLIIFSISNYVRVLSRECVSIAYLCKLWFRNALISFAINLYFYSSKIPLNSKPIYFYAFNIMIQSCKWKFILSESHEFVISYLFARTYYCDFFTVFCHFNLSLFNNIKIFSDSIFFDKFWSYFYYFGKY